MDSFSQAVEALEKVFAEQDNYNNLFNKVKEKQNKADITRRLDAWVILAKLLKF